jgi:hypothetical protein
MTISIRQCDYGTMWRGKCDRCNWLALACSELYVQLLGTMHELEQHPGTSMPSRHCDTLPRWDEYLDAAAGEGEV